MRRTALAVAVAAVALAGCGTPSPDPGTESPTPRGPAATRAPTDAAPERSTAAPRPTPTRRPTTPPRKVAYGFIAIDGDTIRRGGLDVRVIGIDTPEIGECGYEAAGALTARFVARGMRLQNRSGRDQYGRLLAYVASAEGRDLGLVLLRKGLANARYDSTDGYDWHPNQARYRRLDGRTDHVCGRLADSLGGPEPYRAAGRPFPDCATAQSAGAAPLRRGDSGFNPDLDGDGDGVACE